MTRVADFLTSPCVRSRFEQARNLAAAEFRQVEAKRFVPQSADVELAANDGAEQVLIVRIEQVEPGIAAASLFQGCEGLSSLFLPARGSSIAERKVRVAPVGGFQQFAQRRETIDGFLHGGSFGFP